MLDLNFEAKFWQTASRLRGNGAPADYKPYVLLPLFLPYSIKGEQFAFLHTQLMKQTEASYVHWPLAN